MADRGPHTTPPSSLRAARAPYPWEQRFTADEIKEMLRHGACMCGIEAAERNRFDTRTTLVATSANCEAHRG